MKTVTADKLRVGDVLFPGREVVKSVKPDRGGIEASFGSNPVKRYWLPLHWKLKIQPREGC
jgi:hypothetical protein